MAHHTARLFHELTQASELLLDPLRRMALDAKLRLAEAKKTRFAAYDNKRKNLVAELEERERAFKKSRVDKDREERERYHESERIKEEGRRLREGKEKARQQFEERSEEEKAASAAKRTEDDPPELGTLILSVNIILYLTLVILRFRSA
jgi:DnaJ family protein C protein 17